MIWEIWLQIHPRNLYVNRFASCCTNYFLELAGLHVVGCRRSHPSPRDPHITSLVALIPLSKPSITHHHWLLSTHSSKLFSLKTYFLFRACHRLYHLFHRFFFAFLHPARSAGYTSFRSLSWHPHGTNIPHTSNSETAVMALLFMGDWAVS